jgi:hypothetical protein
LRQWQEVQAMSRRIELTIRAASAPALPLSVMAR